MVGAQDCGHVVRGPADVNDRGGQRPFLGRGRAEAGWLERKPTIPREVLHHPWGLQNGLGMAGQGQRAARQ